MNQTWESHLLSVNFLFLIYKIRIVTLWTLGLLPWYILRTYETTNSWISLANVNSLTKFSILLLNPIAYPLANLLIVTSSGEVWMVELIRNDYSKGSWNKNDCWWYVWLPLMQHLLVTYGETHFVPYVQLCLALGMTHPWETSKYERKIWGLAWTFYIMKENAVWRSLLEEKMCMESVEKSSHLHQITQSFEMKISPRDWEKIVNVFSIMSAKARAL